MALSSAIAPLDAASYTPHELHRGERAWVETNCYVDLWIEVLHALGYDPHALLPFTVNLDFEGDQWLFFKPPTADLFELYGLDVQELTIWRNVLDHVVEQVLRGRILLVEVDAFYLPDTTGVSYRSQHSKTTIGIQSIDLAEHTIGYFHNAGYFQLGGDDFAALFQRRRPEDLVPYTEFVKLDRRRKLPPEELLARSLKLLRRQLARRPKDNPVRAFRDRFDRDLVWLREQPPEVFHQYAFASLRQCGACYELAGSYAGWLGRQGEGGLEQAGEAFAALAEYTKAVQFKAARAVLLKRPVDFAPMFDAMERAWERAIDELERKYGPSISVPCPAWE